MKKTYESPLFETKEYAVTDTISTSTQNDNDAEMGGWTV